MALVAAVAHPHRVRALALYELTLFALLDAESPPPNDADCFRRALDEASTFLDASDPHRAAQQFVDYWSGKGAWVRTLEARKQAIVASITNLRQWASAVLDDSTPLAAFAKLDIPVLYMIGTDSPPSSRSLGRLLTRVLPRVQLVEFEGIGHGADHSRNRSQCDHLALPRTVLVEAIARSVRGERARNPDCVACA